MEGLGEIIDKKFTPVYIGGFKNNQFDGFGYIKNDCNKKEELEINQWDNYKGLFKGNVKDGIGYLYLKNGDYFLGEFKNDKIFGFGIYYTEGSKICGIWRGKNLVQPL